MNTQLHLIQGLSKRERSKIQRLMKNDEANKAQTHAKSFKRKAGKGKNSEQSAQRKLLNNEANGMSEHGESASSPASEFMKNQNQEAQTKKKKIMKILKPFNPNFPVEGGEQALCDYLLLYSFNEKQKKAEQPIQDFSFLDNFEGEQLQMVDNSVGNQRKDKVSQEFQLIRQKIEAPFDQIHREFTRRISSQQFWRK